MNGAEARGQNLAAFVEMPQIRTAVVTTGVARTGRVERRSVCFVPRIADLEHAGGYEQMAIARVPCRHDAVEHVDAAPNCLDQVLRRTYSHEVARPVRGQVRLDCIEHFFPLLLRLADGQTADRIAVEADALQ